MGPKLGAKMENALGTTSAALLAALIILPADAAWAGWQGMEWGMSPEQVAAASKVPLRIPDAEQARAETTSQWGQPALVFNIAYSIRSFDFDGALYFLAGGLTSIHLTSRQEGSCNAAREILTQNYGVPDAPGDLRCIWFDNVHHNRIELFDLTIIHSCQINYMEGEAGPGTL